MIRTTRRGFLSSAGRGAALLGLSLSVESELALALACGDRDAPLDFGPLERLAAMMQETPIERLLPLLVGEIRGGTDLRTLVAAGSLANARTFGGTDYVGFHAFMALVPAFEMAKRLPVELAPLPVLKVLHRSSARIREFGGRSREKLCEIDPGHADANLRDTVRNRDVSTADRILARHAKTGTAQAYNELADALCDDAEVHRVVLMWRAYETLEVTGMEHATTLLRQPIRFFVDDEDGSPSSLRKILPRLIEEHGLQHGAAGKKWADDATVDGWSREFFSANPDSGAELAAALLGEGHSPDAVGEAQSLAANRLLLGDPGREQPAAGRPVGSVHGASVGVHGSDSARAWRNIAAVCDGPRAVKCLIAGAYHVGGRSHMASADPHPREAALEAAARVKPEQLQPELREAIEAKDQGRACALTRRCAEAGVDAKVLFDLFLRSAVQVDGALHAEKYFGTCREEFEAARPAFRWRQLESLARVTASSFGIRSDGHDEAKELLGV